MPVERRIIAGLGDIRGMVRLECKQCHRESLFLAHSNVDPLLVCSGCNNAWPQHSPDYGPFWQFLNHLARAIEIEALPTTPFRIRFEFAETTGTEAETGHGSQQ